MFLTFPFIRTVSQTFSALRVDLDMVIFRYCLCAQSSVLCDLNRPFFYFALVVQ